MRSPLASLWFSKFLLALSLVFVSGCALGCSTASYLLQAAKGQLELSNRARPIHEVAQDPKTPPGLKDLLSQVPEIKKFGEQYGLTPTQSYTEYVALGRPHVVSVVSASAPFAFESKTWSFPIVGSMPYLGFFDGTRAHEFADQLSRDPLFAAEGGYDIEVGGASAYSTLGWFKDPLLSSMIPMNLQRAEAALVNVLLHESVHATFYLNDQSAFNESLANFVADRLTRRWLEKKDPALLAAFDRREAEGALYGKRLHALYAELDTLYRSAEFRKLSLVERQKQKRERIARAEADLDQIYGVAKSTPREWRLNNAVIAQFKTYNSTEALEFERLLSSVDGDWVRFWSLLRRLNASSFERRQEPAFGAVVRRLTNSKSAASLP